MGNLFLISALARSGSSWIEPSAAAFRFGATPPKGSDKAKKKKAPESMPPRDRTKDMPYEEFLDPSCYYPDEAFPPTGPGSRPVSPKPGDGAAQQPPATPQTPSSLPGTKGLLSPPPEDAFERLFKGLLSPPPEDAFERLFQMEPDPLQNGDMAIWPFEELVETVERLVPDYVDGKLELAVRYTHGVKGAPKNKALAEKWYRSAAMQGDARAQYYLGLFLQNEFPRLHPWWKDLFESVSGVQLPTREEKEACVWFFLAANQVTRKVPEVDEARKAFSGMVSTFSRRNYHRLMGEARRIQAEIDAAKKP